MPAELVPIPAQQAGHWRRLRDLAEGDFELTRGTRGSPTAFGGRGFRLLGLWPCLTEDNDGVVIPVEEGEMRAVTGDELVVRGRHVGDEGRIGEIIEVHGQGGAPPYLVRWKDGHESVIMPSCDTIVEHRLARQQTN